MSSSLMDKALAQFKLNQSEDSFKTFKKCFKHSENTENHTYAVNLYVSLFCLTRRQDCLQRIACFKGSNKNIKSRYSYYLNLLTCRLASGEKDHSGEKDS